MIELNQNEKAIHTQPGFQITNKRFMYSPDNFEKTVKTVPISLISQIDYWKADQPMYKWISIISLVIGVLLYPLEDRLGIDETGIFLALGISAVFGILFYQSKQSGLQIYSSGKLSASIPLAMKTGDAFAFLNKIYSAMDEE